MKRVLSLWKVLILVFASFVAVGGATALGLYLAGALDEKKVEPDNIEFVYEVKEGDAYYNAELSQFETSSDFKIMVTTSTEGVTEKNVKLSLDKGVVANGYVSNGIISVPETVKLNTAFSVKLERPFNENVGQDGADWVKGGIATITAKSANELKLPAVAKVAVDVPVDTIGARAVAVDGEVLGAFGEVQKIVDGEDFKIQTLFTPEESKFLFSDTNREKEIFYSISSNIGYTYSTDTFHATRTTGQSLESVTVYTFANSYYQKTILDQYANITNQEDLSAAVLSYFKENPHTCKSVQVDIQIVDGYVETVEMLSHDTVKNVYVDQYFDLSVNTTTGNTLGLIVRDSDGVNQLSKYAGNVGIKLTSEIENLNILGGDVMRVVENANGTYAISRITFAQYEAEKNDKDKNFYLLPNTQTATAGSYYWRMSTAKVGEYRLNFNFFSKKDGEWQNFFKFVETDPQINTERYIVLNAQMHDGEAEIAWKTNSPINMEINYNADGSPVYHTEKLADHMLLRTGTNVYNVRKFFLIYDGDATADGVDLQDYFLCKTGVEYGVSEFPARIVGINNIVGDSYSLHEIDGENLTAIKSISQNVKIVSAIVKHGPDGTEDVYNVGNGNVRYKIIKITRAKDVKVENTLSIANMDASFTFDGNFLFEGLNGVSDDYKNQYLIPSINRKDGNDKIVIKVNLILNDCEETDIEKLERARTDNKLNVVCVNEEREVSEQQCLSLESFKKLTHDPATKTATFEIGLLIKDSFFAPNYATLSRGTYVGLQLQYDDGKNIFTKEIYSEEINPGDPVKDHFYIYCQQPTQILNKVDGKEITGLKATINITTDGISIVYETPEVGGLGGSNGVIEGGLETGLEQFNEKFFAFMLKDQFGREIDEDLGIYDVKFTETPETKDDFIFEIDEKDNIISAILSTLGLTKESAISITVVDKNGNDIYVYENDLKTETLLSVPAYTFEVTSEGVHHIMYDATTEIVERAPGWAPETKNDGISEINIRKYVVADSTVQMDSLFEIHKKEQEGATKFLSEFEVYLDNNYISSIDDDLMAMLKFNGEDQASVSYWKDKEITSIDFLLPFGEDTEIVFKVVDPNKSLFAIRLNFTFLSDLTFVPNFENYYDQNEDYLVKAKNSSAISLFAGAEYDLGTYITFFSKTDQEYSWLSCFDGADMDNTELFKEVSTEHCSLRKTADTVYLVIDDLYQFTTIEFTLYYKADSIYACQIPIKIYANPNIVIRKKLPVGGENPFVDLKEMDSLGEYYEFYKATDYLDGNTFDGKTALDASGFTYENSGASGEQYLSLAGTSFAYVEGSTLTLDYLGQTKVQSFKLYHGEGASRVAVDAITIIEDAEGGHEVELCTFTSDNSDHVTLSFDVGYGGGDATQAADLIKRYIDDTDPDPDVTTPGYLDVRVVSYVKDDEENVYYLFMTGEKYVPGTGSGLTIVGSSIRGNLNFTNTGSGVVSTQVLANKFISYDNSFQVQAVLNDELTVNIMLKAIVTDVGENFVYYGETQSADFHGLIAEHVGTDAEAYKLLETNGVYQELNAGAEYTIVYLSESDLTSKFGFHFNEDKTGIGAGTAGYTVSIVESAEGYTDGIAEYANGKLKINNLAVSENVVYIVLKIELMEYSTGVSEKLSWYYRIKVVPNYTLGAEVVYPYTSDAEHLDADSIYFDSVSQTYNLPLEETFTMLNSANKVGESRFPIVVPEAGASIDLANITAAYSVVGVQLNGEIIEKEAYSSYFEVVLGEGGTLIDGKFGIKLKDQTSKLTIIVERKLFYSGVEMVGSARNYTIKFNQSKTYEHTLTREDAKPETDPVEYEDKTATKIVKEGNVYYTTIVAGEEHSRFTADLKISEAGTSTDAEIAGVAPSANILLAGVSASYNEDEQQLYIIPPAHFNEDFVGEVVVYSDEKVVFKVVIQFKGAFTIAKNAETEVVGGKTYSFLEDSNFAGQIFETLAPISAETKIKTMTLELLNEDESKNFVAYKIDTQNYFTSVNIEGTPTVVEIAEWTNTYLQFARLESDTTFTFEIVLTVYNPTTWNGTSFTEQTFTFELEVIVKADFDTTKTYVYQDTADRFGQVEFEIDIYAGDGVISTILGAEEAERLGYKFKDIGEVEKETPTDVGENTRVVKNYTLVYGFETEDGFTKFGSEDGIYEFNLEYQYTTKPNVTVSPNYPKPNAESNLQTEYIATKEETVEGTVKFKTDSTLGAEFFTSTAPFAEASRIAVAKVSGVASETITYNWLISIVEISNVVIDNGTTTFAENGVLYSDDVAEGETPALNLTFTLDNSARNGTVVFTVSVNEVQTEYAVEIVKEDSVVSIATNSPNYTNNKETIFAEDLAKQEQEIFAKNRIFKYNIKTTQTVGATYYLRFVDDAGTVKVESFKSTKVGETVNYDLGKTFDKYKYAGTFATKANAESGTSKLDDEIYQETPLLTRRTVVRYYNGDIIDFGDDSEAPQLVIYESDDTPTSTTNLTMADEFKIEAADFNEDKKLKVAVALGLEDKGSGVYNATNGFLISNFSYNVFLDIEFTVAGNANGIGNYRTVTVKAGQEHSFWSYDFGIRNARTGLSYSAEKMKDSSAEISLKIYGFTDSKVLTNIHTSGTDLYNLTNAAQLIHNNLIKEETEDGTIFHTGLTPRAGADIDTIEEGGEFEKNYITLQGVLADGKTIDYNVFAQGANNDGNHVMMRLTYRIKIGDNYIEKHNNILFKVEPNSTMLFRRGTSFGSSSTEIVNNQSVATNFERPFEITNANSETKIYFFDTTEEEQEVIQAKMYGSSSDTASRFTYTYQQYEEGNGVKLGYNDWTLFNTTNSNSVQTGTGTKYVIVPELSLGEKHFYVDLKNAFDYKARFYFSAISTLNPQIESLNTYTVKEGQAIAVGSKFIEMTPVKDGDYVMFEEFNYTNRDANVSVRPNYNLIRILNGTSKLMSEIRFEIAVGGAVYTRTQQVTGVDDTCFIWVNGETGQTIEWTNKADLTKNSSITDDQISSVIVSIKINSSSDIPLKTYDITYGYDSGADLVTQTGINMSYPLKQLYTESSTFKNPEFKTGNPPASVSDVEVTLNGITAYGYEKSQGGIDINAQESSINQVFVDKIDFYLGDKLLGTSNNEGETPIITNADYTFLDKGVTGGAGDPSFTQGENTVNKDSDIEWDDDDVVWGISLPGHLKTTFKIDVKYNILQDINGDEIAGTAGSPEEVAGTETITITNYFGRTKNENITEKIKTYIKNLLKEKVENVGSTFEYGSIHSIKIHSVTTESTGKSSPGVGADTNNNYIVPTIDGIHFGTGSVIQNVLMRVTLKDESENTHVVSEYVTLEKSANTTGRFNNKVLDGNSPTQKSGTVLNDTIEIKLQPGESITYAISDREEVDSKLTVTVPQASKVTFRLYKNGAEQEHIDSARQIVIDNTSDNANAMIRTIDISQYVEDLKDNDNIIIEKISAKTSGSDAIFKYQSDEVDDMVALEKLSDFDQLNSANLTYNTITNSRTYAITEYIGISASVRNLLTNFDEGNDFYIYVKDKSANVKILYNGAELSLSTDEEVTDPEDSTKVVGHKTTGAIARYSNTSLKMNIENIAELGTAKFKTEKLYFIAVVGTGEAERRYQVAEDFKVYPTYQDAENPNATSDDYFKITPTYEVSGSVDGEKYYIITLKDWANEVKWKDNLDEAKGVGTTTTATVFDSRYKVYFRIGSTDYEAGAGSACIDENGMITTTEFFDPKTHTITVEIYNKLSGFDGNFEGVIIDERLLVAKFRLYFDQSAMTFNEMSDPIVSDINIRFDNLITKGYSTVKRNSASTEQYEGDPLPTHATSTSIADNENTFTANVGETIEFDKLFADFEWEVLDTAAIPPVTTGEKIVGNNKNYHLIRIHNAADGTDISKDVCPYFNNLNSYKFTAPGNYTLTFVASAWTSDGFEYVDFKANIIVYETSTYETRQEKIQLTSGSGTKTLGAGFDWYKISDNGMVTLCTDGEDNFSEDDLGIVTRRYLAENNETKETKIVTIEYFVYVEQPEINVAVRPQIDISMADILPKEDGAASSVIYKVGASDKIERKAYENFAFGVNKETNATYIVISYNADGDVVSSYSYKVNFHFIDTNVENVSSFETITTESDGGDPAKYTHTLSATEESVKAAIAAELGVGVGNIASVQELNGYALTNFATLSIVTEAENLTTNFLQKRYFVEYTVSGATKFRVVNYVFYIHSGTEAYEYLQFLESASNSYKLVNLDERVITLLRSKGHTIADGTVLSYYHLVDGVLERIEAVDAEMRYTETLYVKAGDSYYLIEATILSEPGREYSMEISSGTSIETIKTKMLESLGATATINEVKEKNGTGASVTWEDATDVTFTSEITKVYRVKYTKDGITSYYPFTFYFTEVPAAS